MKMRKGKKKTNKPTLRNQQQQKIQMQLYVSTDPQVFLILKQNSAESKLKRGLTS